MRAALGLMIVAALARAAHADAHATVSHALLDAVAKQDVAAFDRFTPAPISLHGLWFDAPDCAKQFSGQGRLTMLAVADHPAFLKCLATLGLRIAPGGDNAAAPDLTYDPGVLIRLGVQGGLIRGFTVRGAAGDPAAASLTPQALAAQRTAGAHDVAPDRAGRERIAASPDGVAFAEITVCVDPQGHVEPVSAVVRRSTNDPGYLKLVDAAVARWQFKPFVAHGKPVRVCAIDAFTYPPGHAPPAMPTPPAPPAPPAPPSSPPAALQNVPPKALDAHRLPGDTRVVPDRETLAAMDTAGATDVTGVFKLCINEQGVVSVAQVLRSTRFAAYDQAVVRAMQNRKYTPFSVARKPSSVCTAETVVYHRDKPHAAHAAPAKPRTP